MIDRNKLLSIFDHVTKLTEKLSQIQLNDLCIKTTSSAAPELTGLLNLGQQENATQEDKELAKAYKGVLWLKTLPEDIQKSVQDAISSDSVELNLNSKGKRCDDKLAQALHYLIPFSKIISLDVSYLGFSQAGVCLIAELPLIKLKMKSIGDNVVSNSLGERALEALAKNKTIKILDISKNYLDSSHALKLAENKVAERINISHNQIGYRGLLELVKMPQVKSLNISSNPFSSKINLVVDEISKRNTLQEVKLSDLCLTDTDLKGFEGCTSLRSLDLSFNNINEVTSLPAISSLNYLNLDGNNFTAEAIGAIKRPGLVVTHRKIFESVGNKNTFREETQDFRASLRSLALFKPASSDEKTVVHENSFKP